MASPPLSTPAGPEPISNAYGRASSVSLLLRQIRGLTWEPCRTLARNPMGSPSDDYARSVHYATCNPRPLTLNLDVRSFRAGLRMGECRTPAFSEQLLPVKIPKNLEHLGNQSRPTGLVAGTDTSTVIAMKVFVEQNVVAPVGISLELVHSAEHRPAAGLIP